MIFPWNKPTIWGTPWLWKPSKKPTLPNINQLQLVAPWQNFAKSAAEKALNGLEERLEEDDVFFSSEPGDPRIWIYWVQDGAPKIGVSCLVSGLINYS